MILVDTSVWVDHLRQTEPALVQLLNNGLVLMHPFIRGELACGNLKDQRKLLSDLAVLPAAKTASTEEVLDLIELRKLSGLGLSWIDVHLLASALLSNARLWTIDKRLHDSASQLRLV